jgi:hypothetical protein
MALSTAVTTALGAVTGLLGALPAAAVASCDTNANATWIGGDAATPTDWSTVDNWQGSVAPTSSSAVFIPAGATITGVSGTVCSVTVNPGSGDATLSGSLTLNGPGISVPSATTLSLQGGTYTWPDGMPVLGSGSTGNGTLSIGSGATVVVQGLSTIGNVNLQLAGGEIHGDATSSQPTLKQQDGGELDWSAGTMSGTLLLDVLTNADCSGCAVAAQSTVGTTSRTAFEFRTGSIEDEGTLVNGGILRFHPGTSMTGGGVLRNTVVDALGNTPPTLVFGPDVGQTQTGPVDISVSVDNAQHIEVASGTNATLTGATSAFEAGTVLDGAGAAPPAGVFSIGNGATVNVSGSTTMMIGITIALDDGGDGTHATLHGATSDAKLAATVTSTQPTPGTFDWKSGTVTGPLTIAGATTAISAGAGHALDGPLKLQGPTNVAAAGVSLRQGATIDLSDKMTITGPGAHFDRAAGTTGQSLTVESGGTLRRTPGTTATYAPNEWATVGVGLVNHGTVELDASLDVPGGYSQSSVSHPPTGASPPVTALLGGATLKSSAVVSVSGGGVGGKGTISTPTLKLANSWIGPGYRANCHEVKADFGETCIGTITVAGALALASGADVQVVVRSATAHDTLVVTKGATLTGKLTAATGTGYKPPYGLVVANVVRYASRSGAFASNASPGAPVGFGWRPSYDDVADSDGRGVDVRLADIAAPTMGFAGIPAFTQQNVVQVAYAAVDNKTGVASYDVRWRKVGLTGAFSRWVYPKTWQHTKARTEIVTGAAEGFTYCVQVRARDHAGNLSPWTAAPCSARMLDDRFLRATAGWTRLTAPKSWYDKTATQTTTAHVTLRKWATFSRVAISAYRCPRCGTLLVYAGPTLLKTWNLASAKPGHTSWVSKALPRKLLPLRLVTTRKRLVQIDAVGLLH